MLNNELRVKLPLLRILLFSGQNNVLGITYLCSLIMYLTCIRKHQRHFNKSNDCNYGKHFIKQFIWTFKFLVLKAFCHYELNISICMHWIWLFCFESLLLLLLLLSSLSFLLLFKRVYNQCSMIYHFRRRRHNWRYKAAIFRILFGDDNVWTDL